MQRIISRQAEFQETHGHSNFEVMYKALLEELGEFVQSLGYHDWKATERDERNMIIELVDMTIFALNCLYYKPQYKTGNTQNLQASLLQDDYDFVRSLVVHISIMDFEGLIAAIFTAYPDVKLRVVGKQALNVLRQENGYRTGEYVKIWSGREDNAYLMDLLDYCNSYEEIYSKLKALYNVHN